MLLHKYIWRRVKRLYLPMVVWTFIYIFARNLKHHFYTHLPPVHFDFAMLLSGSAYHLWFLPVLMIVTILAAVLNRFCTTYPNARMPLIYTCAIAGTVLAVVPRPDWMNYINGDAEGIFFYGIWRSLPAICLGLSLAWWLAFVRRGALFSTSVGFAGLLLTAAMVANQILYGYTRLDRTLSGLGWLMVALTAWNAPWVPMLARLGRYSYGIYLVHVLILEALQAIFHHAGYGVSVQLDLFIMLVTFVASAAIAVSIAQVRWLRWLNGD
jgi:peptidoglycan/LPS O-acetylase OafA/YrhL